ncbi:MAG: hypothetical protein K2J33_04230 [Alistipes sp.]|nr:hypothetical protein [Alistipes sp.]
MKRLTAICLILRCAACLASAPVEVCPSEDGYQWRVDVAPERCPVDESNPTRAYMWIPPTAERVRGVVFACHNEMEQGVVESPEFRRAMAELGFAIVWLTPTIEPSGVFYAGNGAQRIFERTMRSLAEASGYDEVEHAPVVYIGHSARASEPYNFGAWNPGRALALVSLHGDSPQSRVLCCDHVNPDWGDRTIDGIPALMCVGEYEWGEFRIESSFPFMRRYPAAVLSLLCDAGHAHSDISGFEIDYIVEFIRAAARMRLPEGWDGRGRAELRRVDVRDCWLADRWRRDAAPTAQAAPYDEYGGCRDSAFVYLDERMVRLTEEYYARERGRRERRLVVRQRGREVERVEFRPDADGVTYHASVGYDDATRSDSKIRLRRECGPVEIVGDTTFRLRFDRAGFADRRLSKLGVYAAADADGEYKRSVADMSVRVPLKITAGQPQTIDFPPLDDVKAGSAEAIRLQARSTSGMRVYYYVEEGAAHIEGDTLVFDPIPPRAAMPMRVTVVAWQHGVQGLWQTAEPVSRTFRMVR